MSRGSSGEKRSRFPLSIFWIVLSVLLITAGVHVAILLGMEIAGWDPIVQTHIMVLYWISVSVLLTLLIRSRMKVAYDTPLQEISEATKKVAHGDFSVRIAPLHEEGKEDYLDTMIRDLNAMITELGSIETLKTDFVSNVSHEIKTPLAVIQNYSSLLNAENLPEHERKEYAVAISAAAIRLNTLITNVLRLSRLENQQIRPKSEHTSDRELLSIVWNNLLSNAFKFTEEGGTVSVSLRTEDETAVVSVKDTGCGMPPETVRHVFDKFYQGDTSHSIQGNGLGLALVKRIVDIVGGEIRVESEPGEGSTFTVKLTGASKKN